MKDTSLVHAARIRGSLVSSKREPMRTSFLVYGNPLENPDPVADSDRDFIAIVKDGKIYENAAH